MAEWPSSRSPGESVPPGRVKLTVVLTSEEVEVLEQQANADGISVTDVIRRSIEVGRIAWEAQRRRGARILLQSPDGDLRPIDLPQARS